MQPFTLSLIYVATGAFAGLCSGLFGIGGGLVMVPALMACFAVSGIPADLIPPLALGTSLSAIAFTSLVASREHVKLGNLKNPFGGTMLVLACFLGVGVWLGTAFSTKMPRMSVLMALGVFQWLVAAWMLRGSFVVKKNVDESSGPSVPAQEGLRKTSSRLFMLATGVVSAIGGIGGATLMIPYFTKQKIEYRKAAALSTCLGCVIGGVGFITYGLMSKPAQALPLSFGYVSLPALACMAMGSMYLVKIGARLSQKVPAKILTRVFCVFLVVSGWKMLN